MAVVYIESTIIDMLIYAVIALGIAIAIVCIAWGVREYRTPLESKQLRKAAHKKQSTLLLSGDDGLLEIEPVTIRRSEGTVQTEPKGKTQEHFTGAYPRPSGTPLIPDYNTAITQLNGGTPTLDIEAAKQNRTQAIISYIASLNTKPTFLKGAKIAFGVAYRGKAIITTIAALAGLKTLDDLSQLYPDDMIKVNINDIKHYFSNQWNQSQIQANEEDKFREGQIAANKLRDLKWWILPVLTVALILIGVAAVIAVLKFL